MELSKNIPRSEDILTNVPTIDPIVNTNVVNNSSVANSIGKEISMLHTNTNKVSQRKIGSESDSASSSQITTTNQRPICSSKLFKELKMPIFKRIGTSENSEETSEESYDTNDLIPYAPGKLDESDSEEPTRVPPELKEVHDRVQRSLETRDALSSDMFGNHSDIRRAASQDASTSRTTAAHQSGSDSEEDIPLAVRRQTKSRSVGFDPISEDEDIHQPPKEKTKKAKKVEVTDPKKPKRGPGRPRKHPLPDSAP
ncbi:hypothetical protein U1Q18_047117 [Sarracenia purpurea var. burkii]